MNCSQTLFRGSGAAALQIMFFIALMGSAVPAVLAGSEINTGYFGNVAIQGYDTVAYFTEGKATKGRKEHTLDWLGAKWLFSSAEHKQTFAASPLSYAPQYGGHCAVGTAFGQLTTEIDPEAWLIIDGKLYLNYAKSVNEVMTADKENLIKKADARWRQELRQKKAKD